MKSVKPGRGPSFMGGIIGIFVALFGVVWTILAVSSGAGFMGVFGLIFVVIAVIQTVYNFKNATSENRYSEFDITDDGEEIDPWNERFGAKKEVNREQMRIIAFAAAVERSCRKLIIDKAGQALATPAFLVLCRQGKKGENKTKSTRYRVGKETAHKNARRSVKN